MISIVLTYHNRLEQLRNTLYSFSLSEYKDFNVIIVDDCSTERITDIGPYDFGVEILRLTEKISNNPAPVFNIGLKHAIDNGADIVIIQNAECFHWGDVIKRASTLSPSEFLSFHAYSLSVGQLPGQPTRDVIPFNSGDEGWYNHERVRPVMFHFCCALSAENLKKLNGFDERFSEGICYDDDYFVHQVKNLKLKVKFVASPFVYHQWHAIGARPAELITKNEQLWTSLKTNHEYRAKHTITQDL